MISVDLSTMRLSIILTATICAIALVTIWRINRQFPGVTQWTLGICIALAAFTIGLIGVLTPLPDRIALLTTNVLSLLTFMLLVEGCLRFRGHASNWRWKGIWAAVPLLGLLIWINLDNTAVRYLFHDTIAVTLLVSAAFIMARQTRSSVEFQVYGLTSAFSLIVALAFATRWSFAAGSLAFGELPVSAVNMLVYPAILVFFVGFGFAVTAACYYRSHREALLLAARDELTGLPNRRAINETMQEWLKSVERYGDRFAVVLIDLDDFKAVNDSRGHAAGDRVLQTIAARFAAALRDTDFVGRFGGDEFVLLLRTDKKEQIEPALKRMWQQVRTPDDEEGMAEQVTFSFGVAHCPADGDTVDQLINTADRRMYSYKQDTLSSDAQEHSLQDSFAGSDTCLS